MKPRLPEILTIGSFVVGIALWAGMVNAQVQAQARELSELKSTQEKVLEQIRKDIEYMRGRLDTVLDGQR